MDASSAATQYQNTGTSSAQTGNPQNISSSNLQPQQSGLQDAAQQTSDAIKLLDQGKGTIRVNGVPVSTSTRTATVVTAPKPASAKNTNSWVYAGLGLVVVIFMIGLYWGLMREPK